MPGENLLEMSRRFIYKENNLLDTAKLEDIKARFIDIGTGFNETGRFTHKYFDWGLVKIMDGTGYAGRYKAKIEFKYYSNNQLLR